MSLFRKSPPDHGHDHGPDSASTPSDDGAERPVLDPQTKLDLQGLFQHFQQDVEILLFAAADGVDVFSTAARKVLRAMAELSPRIRLSEHAPDSPRARDLSVSATPTIIMSPERCRFRYLGAPVGEEGRTLIEALILLGFGDSSLSPPSRKLLKTLDGPRQVKVFVSLTCPYCPQQAINALKAALERPDLVAVEIVDIQANPDLADQYGAHSTPQAFAGDKLIALGAQAEELFMASLVKLEQQTIFIPDSDAQLIAADLVVVGGGPAGLTAAIYGARSGLKTVVIEKDALGGQVATTPVVENYPGLTSVGGKALVDLMVSHALEYCQIFPGEEVMEITPGQPLALATNRRRFTARAVLLATGARHRQLGAPGEQRLAGRGVSYCATCDGPLFKNRAVLMVGGGDSAVTEALHLANQGASVTLVHRREKLRAQARLVEQLENLKIPVIYNAEVKEIKGQERVEAVVLADTAGGPERELKVDGVFVAVGYDPANALARRLGLALTPEGYIQVDERHHTSQTGVYAAGDVQGGFKQIVTAAGQGAAAAMSIFEDLMNPYWTRTRAEKA
ncbi:MAG: FAD-dependent oxidoreductase [Desulfarculus sp.]|nr:FAD-dependent oxidoreductase [Desulfarculus sp.]